MKLNIPKINTDVIKKFSRNNLRYLPAAMIGLIAIVFSVLTYFALFPREDKVQLAEGYEKEKTLDIRFNSKLLKELETTKTPTQLGTAGGRDPFSGF